MGGEYYDEPRSGPRLHCNFPTVQLAMPSYDSRTIDDVIVPKALTYIQDRATAKVSFRVLVQKF